MAFSSFNSPPQNLSMPPKLLPRSITPYRKLWMHIIHPISSDFPAIGEYFQYFLTCNLFSLPERFKLGSVKCSIT